MNAIDAATMYKHFLKHYETDVSNLKLAEKTRQALLVAYYVTERRNRTYEFCRGIRILKRPYWKNIHTLPDVKKQKFRHLWTIVGYLLCDVYRVKNADELLADTRRFNLLLKEAITQELEKAKRAKASDIG